MTQVLGKLRFVASVRVAFALAVGAIAIAASVSTSLVQAQATRTWVSGVGDDVNPCSRTAPCKTFAGAISKTAAGGEIDCLDPGGFGAVTITKSITIDCHGQASGSILASGTNGVNVNDSATGTPNTIVVNLRGLNINGAGTTLGVNGVNFVSGAVVTVQDCFIINFSNAGINTRGPTTGGVFHQLEVIDTTISRVGVGGAGTAGIILGVPSPGAPSPGVVRASIIDSEISLGNVGIRVSPTAVANLERTSVESNISFGAVVASGGGIAQMNVSNSDFSASIAGEGIHSEGNGAVVRLDGTSITGNATGIVAANGGQILSAGNNFIQGNFTANGVPSGGGTALVGLFTFNVLVERWRAAPQAARLGVVALLTCLVAGVIAVVLLRSTSSHNGEDQAIQGAIRNFERAVREHDVGRVQELTTPDFFRAYLQLSGSASTFAESNPDLALGPAYERRIQRIVVNGDSARVEATIGGADARNIDAIELHLVRRESSWVIDGTAMRKTNAGGAQVVDLKMQDFSFVPDPLFVRRDSTVIFRTKNIGAQPHMVAIWTVPPGANLIKVIEATEAMPDGVERIVQGTTFAPGDEGDITVRGGLKPGRYMLTCFLSDITSPVLTPHYDLGMLTEFQVK